MGGRVATRENGSVRPGQVNCKGRAVTESDWRSSTDVAAMLECLRDKGVSDRRLRLFGVACCRRIWHLLTDDRSRNAVEVAERYADGAVSLSSVRRAFFDALDAPAADANRIDHTAAGFPQSEGAYFAALAAAVCAESFGCEAALRASRCILKGCGGTVTPYVALLHDIFGDPFPPPPSPRRGAPRLPWRSRPGPTRRGTSASFRFWGTPCRMPGVRRRAS